MDHIHLIVEAIADLKKMTLTVIDGDFPREVLAGQNLVFAEFRMPRRRNKPEVYDVKTKQPGGRKPGVLKLGWLDAAPRSGTPGSITSRPLPGMILFAALGVAFVVLGVSVAVRLVRKN